MPTGRPVICRVLDAVHVEVVILTALCAAASAVTCATSVTALPPNACVPIVRVEVDVLFVNPPSV